MNSREFGQLNQFDKIITSGSINFEDFLEDKKIKNRKGPYFYEQIHKRNEINSKIFNDLKVKNNYLTTVFWDNNNRQDLAKKKKSLYNNKHRESFLYRLFYNYEFYVMCFRENVETLEYHFQGDDKFSIKNKREYKVEKQILTNYARDIKNMSGKYPFPENKFEFLYDFFIFLCTNLTDLINIKQIEYETRYNILHKLIIDFKEYTQFFDVNKLIDSELKNLGYSKFQINVVEHVCKTIGLF